jgi:hypothetical protein
VATNNFNSDYDNDAIVPLQTFNDGSGLSRLDDFNISSYAFDGSVPRTTINLITASITPGMQISLTGSALGEPFYRVISNTSSDTEVEDNETGQAVIEYLDLEKNIESITASVSDIFSVNYEDWDNKYLGTKGWYLSNDGNAIFSNVAVRGRIEATEGAIEGNLTLGGSLTASTNTGQLIISSSGIFGSTASGLFHLDNIDGEVSFTGDITANSGVVKKLTIGAGKSYPIINLVGTASVTGAQESGNFILTLGSESKNFSPGDYFYINGPNTSGSAFQNGFPTTASVFFNRIILNKDGSWGSPYTYKILTASYGGPSDRYFCRITQGSLLSNYDFSQVTASSGSINFGYVYFGEYSTYSLSGGTFIDGLVLSTIGPGTFFETYVPDYIDLSGKFRLGKGNITYDGDTLNVIGNINATGGEISGNLSIGGSLTASNNSNQFIVSSSGIFGSSASGSFNLNSISGRITTNSIRINSSRQSGPPPANALFEEGSLFGVTSNFGLNLHHNITATNSGSSINYSFYPATWRSLAYVSGSSGYPDYANPQVITYIENNTMSVGKNGTINAEIALQNFAIDPPDRWVGTPASPAFGIPGTSQISVIADTYIFSGTRAFYMNAPIDDAVSELKNGSFFNMYTDEVSASTYTFFQATTDFLGSPDFKFKLRADGTGLADGAWITPAADYAEYFEWDDGNINNEDRRGVTVVLINEKIKIAEATDDLNDIIGAVSSNPGVIGDSAWNHWHQKYLRDEYGSFIYESHTTVRWTAVEINDEGKPYKKNYFYYVDNVPEDIIIPNYANYKQVLKKTLNPEFDENDSYIPREERKEWTTIGLLGKIRVRSNQLKNPSWKFLKQISDNVEEWLVK